MFLHLLTDSLNGLLSQNAVQNYYFFFNQPNFFSNFARKTLYFNAKRPETEQKRNANNLKAMKKLKKLLGLPLVYAGVAILLLGYVSGLTRHNAVLIIGLLFVLAGAASYVWKERRQSRY